MRIGRSTIFIAAAAGCLAPGSLSQAQPAPPVDPAIPVALMLDLQSGKVLYERETRRRFVPASVTKVMTAFVLFEMIGDGQLALDRRIQVSREVAELWSGNGSSMFLKAGDTVLVENLIMGLTTVSANDAAMVLGIAIDGSMEQWLERMNATARELGMNDSHFGSPNGFPDGGQTFSTAEDLALLADVMIERHPQLYARFFGRHGMSYGGITQANHDPISGVVPGADGIKTGFTREAGYNFLGSASRNGRRLVMMVAGADSGQLRNETSRQFIEWGFSSFANTLLFSSGTPLGEARVQNGSERQVTLRAGQDIYVARPAGSEAPVTLELRYSGPLQAPIAEGAEVARLRISVEGQQPYEVPLEAAEEVEQANLLERVANGIVGLLS